MQNKSEDDGIEQLNFLAKKLCTILKEKKKRIKKLSIVTEPMEDLNARAVSSGLSDFLGYSKIAFYDKTIPVFTAVARLWKKFIPTWLFEKSVAGDKMDLTDEHLQYLGEVGGLVDLNAHDEFERLFFAFFGKPENITAYKDEDTEITSLLRNSIALFVMCHECGHILLKHYKIKVSSIEEVELSWKQELSADFEGYELMRDTMAKIYPEITDKYFFNFGFEFFLKINTIYDLLRQIFYGNEFTATHPDAGGSRLTILREKVREIANKGPQTVIPLFIMYLTDMVFDIFERRLTMKILYWASEIDGKNLSSDNFKKELMVKFSSNDFSYDTDPALKYWEQGEFTLSICEFTKRNYNDNFKNVLAILYVHEYEKHNNRRLLGIGQLDEFRDGVAFLENNELQLAINAFETAKKNDEDNSLVKFALGLAYSKRGIYNLKNRKYKEAIDDFKRDIDISPVACRESFFYRSEALRLSDWQETSVQDKAVAEIIKRAPSLIERTDEWLMEL